MSRKYELIEIAVSRQVLWVGSEAYPLRNIVRAKTVKIVPDHKAAWTHYLGGVVLWIFLGLSAAVAIKLAPRVSSVQGSNALHDVAAGVLVLAAGLFVINTITLLVRLTKEPYYLLSIDTAGTSYRLLASAEPTPLRKLVHEIMKAIDNPAASFHFEIENLLDARGAKGFQIENATHRKTPSVNYDVPANLSAELLITPADSLGITPAASLIYEPGAARHQVQLETGQPESPLCLRDTEGGGSRLP
jgi:hypothetical protein